MAFINIDDVHVLNETGEQVDKVTGLFTKDEGTTEEEKSFAQLNIGASGGGGGGRNLLDNPWFGSGEVVNQRGSTSGTISNAYFIDRWKLSGTYSIAASGITFTCNAGAGFSQIFPRALTIGETYTFSVMYGDGSIVSCTFAPLANRENVYSFGDGLYLEIDTRAAFPTHRCIIYTPGVSWTREIKAVKLEKGSVSTLAQDAPPDYGEELAKCMRYFIRINAPYYNNGFGIGRATGGTTCLVFIPLPVPLRSSPSVSYSNAGNLQLIGNGSNYAVTALAYSGRSEAGVNLSVTSSGISTNHLYFLTKTNQDCYIDLSADL